MFSNGMGNDPFVEAAESASFPLPVTGKREGGEKMQPFNRFASHPVNPSVKILGVEVTLRVAFALLILQGSNPRI